MQERSIRPRQSHAGGGGGRRKGTIFHPTLGYPIQPPMPVTVQRRNQRERNRVKTVNGGYECLRLHVPTAARSKKMSKVDILKHSIQYIQKLRSLVESHHHQSSSGESLRHLVETHHQNLVEQTPLGGIETSTSPHPFSHPEHHSPDAARYHPSTDSQFSPSPNSSNYPHLEQGEGSQTNGRYPHHASPTSPPLMPSPDSSDSGNASLLSYHPTTFQPCSPTYPPSHPSASHPSASQQQAVPQDFSASQSPISSSAAVGFLATSTYQQQTSQEDEILDVIAEWQES